MLLNEVLEQGGLPYMKILGFQAHRRTGGVQRPRDECFEVCGQGDLKFCNWGSENLVCWTVPVIPATGLDICCCGLMLGEQPLCVAVGWNSNFLMLVLKAYEGTLKKKKNKKVPISLSGVRECNPVAFLCVGVRTVWLGSSCFSKVLGIWVQVC